MHTNGGGCHSHFEGPFLVIPSILRFCNFFIKNFFARAGASRPLARSLPGRKPALRAGFRAPTLIETLKERRRQTTGVKTIFHPYIRTMNFGVVLYRAANSRTQPIEAEF